MISFSFLSFFVWCGPFLKSLFTLLDNGFCSSARDLTNTLCFGRQSLNPKITREVQVTWFFNPCVGHPYIYQASSITMRPSKKIGGTSISTTEKGTRMRVGVDKERQDADGSHPCSICKSLCSHPLSSWLSVSVRVQRLGENQCSNAKAGSRWRVAPLLCTGLQGLYEAQPHGEAHPLYSVFWFQCSLHPETSSWHRQNHVWLIVFEPVSQSNQHLKLAISPS